MSGSMIRRALGLAAAASLAGATAYAQVPADIEEGLKKIGQIVDPACTAKLYRPLMPKNDYNTYWPVDAPAPVFKGQLYPGITIARDQSFGPNPKDVVDIFVADKGGENRPVLMYVPGGGGNKIEQQDREANAFYDNIGRWATRNGMVGVTVQRHPGRGGENWDDPGRDISMAVDWVYDNVKKYHGDPNRIFIWAHSAGNGPLGMYVGHPERWKNGVRVKGAIFMSGAPANPNGPAAGRGGAPGGAPGAPGAPAAAGAGGPGGGRGAGGPQAGAACGSTSGPGGNEGRIAGPSGMAAAPAGGRGGGAPGAPGAPGGGGRGQALTPEQQAERDNMPGFLKTNAHIMLAWAELDPGIMNAQFPANITALHDALCKTEGPSAKDGEGRCPVLHMGKGESHMSEVFSPDTNDKITTNAVLAFMKKVK
jgi:hypothetical protein